MYVFIVKISSSCVCMYLCVCFYRDFHIQVFVHGSLECCSNFNFFQTLFLCRLGGPGNHYVAQRDLEFAVILLPQFPGTTKLPYLICMLYSCLSDLV